MSKKVSESHTMGIRLDTAENFLLEKYSSLLNKKKSQILKEAFRYWVMTQKNIENREFLLFPKPVIISFFRDTDQKIIRGYAKEQSEKFLGEFKIMMLEKGRNETIDNLILNLNEVFSIGLLKWFSTFEAKFDKNSKHIQIYGLHSMNKNFSLFLIEFLSGVLSKGFNFELMSTDDTINDNAIHLNFEEK